MVDLEKQFSEEMLKQDNNIFSCSWGQDSNKTAQITPNGHKIEVSDTNPIDFFPNLVHWLDIAS